MTTEREFQDQVVSFRRRMGEADWTGEQRRNGFKMLALSYLRLDEPTVEMAELFKVTTNEYVRRMFLMGLTPSGEALSAVGT